MERRFITVYGDEFHDFSLTILGKNYADREADGDWYRSLPKEKRYRIVRLLEYRYQKYDVKHVSVKYFKCLNNAMEKVKYRNQRIARIAICNYFARSNNAALRIYADQLKLVKY